MLDAHSLPSRRGRRVLIALLILLLILLPLYLWPLRWGLGGLPGASALPGSPRDPRSAAAVARIPGDVWDALMGPVDAPPPSPPPTTPPRNLTMITQAEQFGSGLDQDAGGAPLSESPESRARHDRSAQRVIGSLGRHPRRRRHAVRTGGFPLGESIWRAGWWSGNREPVEQVCS